MATITHLPSLYMPDGHSFECDDRQARNAINSFDATGFKVTRGPVELRDGSREYLDIVWAPRGEVRILAAREVRS